VVQRARRRWQGRGRRPVGRAVLSLVAVVAAAPGLVVAFQGLAPDAPSPASGHAQVIAQGVSPMPDAEVTWRVVLDTAETPERAEVQERALGFALADRAAIVVDDAGSGAQARLAPGEALFVPAGARQRRASVDGADAPYYRLALVPAGQANDAGGDRLVFAGDPFPAPAGRAFDLDLVRDVLAPNEETTLPGTGSQTLVIATAGGIEVEGEDAGTLPVRLAAGQAAAFDGEIALFGVGDRGGTFVAATIGPEVPAPPAPRYGSVSLRVLGCPQGVTPEAATADGFSASVADCQPLALDPAPTLTLAGNQPLPPDQPDPATATYTWTGLISGPFPVALPALPRGYDRALFVDGSGAVVEPPLFDVGAAPFEATATLYLFRGETGSLTLGFFACPAGMTRDDLVGDFCEPSGGDFAVEIADTNDRTVLGRDDADETTGAFLTWSELPAGRYAVRVADLPSGYDDYLIPVAEFDPGSGAYLVDVGGQQPAAQFNAYFLQEQPQATGSVTVRVFDCPPGMGRDDLVGDICQGSSGFDLLLYRPDGTTLGLGDAEFGGNVATWSGLTPGDYFVEETALPQGFTDAYAPNTETSGLNPAAYLVRVTADAPAADLAIYNLRPEAGTPAQTPPAPLDSDGDGLADDAEPSVGTDPFNPDSDGDGRADGDEIGPRRVVTDPLDPDSDDDGIDDGDEIAVGTDPNDPNSR